MLVALATGFTGPNKGVLRTTALVVVVLTVIMLGGTTSRMLEVMGIRTDIDNGGGDSSTGEEERVRLRSGRLGRAGARWGESLGPPNGAAQQQARTAHLRHLRQVCTKQPQPHDSGVERG